jgi:tRNA pseudouridine55 synthase
MVNDATRWFDRLQKELKVYEATLLLGAGFDSQDITGTLERFSPPDGVPGRESLLEALESFTGETEQVPPVYSAIKIRGKPAYHYARKGKSPAMPARKVYIESMELLDYDFPHVTFRVACKKGFYVRSLCEDIAARLSTISVLSRLRRTAQSGHRVNEAVAPRNLPDDYRDLLVTRLP